MLKLYTYFRSSAAYRVRIALNLKRLGYAAIPTEAPDAGLDKQFSATASRGADMARTAARAASARNPLERDQSNDHRSDQLVTRQLLLHRISQKIIWRRHVVLAGR